MAYGELYKGTFRKYQENGTAATLSDNMRQTLDKMRHIKFEDFFNKTYSKITMIQCRNGIESKTCKDDWREITNLYGRCMQYIPPPEVQAMDPTDMRLEFVVAFNDSDSTAGWFQFFLGTTLYLSSTVEETLDPMYSLNLRFILNSGDANGSSVWLDKIAAPKSNNEYNQITN